MNKAYTVSRKEFQDLFAEVRALKKMTVEHGSGFELSKNRAGYSLRKAKRDEGHPKRLAGGTDIKPVAIVREIDSEATSMTVREVAYADTPPGESLIYKGSEFTAYPYWGDVTTLDYQGFEFTGERPDVTTRVFDARKSGEAWVLERPSTKPVTSEFGIIVEAASGQHEMRVLVVTASEQGEVQFTNTYRTARTWPQLVSDDYEHHLNVGAIVEMAYIDSHWYAKLTTNLIFGEPSTAIELECG